MKELDELLKLIDYFRNNVVCRRDMNQHVANNTFNIIRGYISHADSIDVIDAWSEYRNGDINIKQFSEVINDLRTRCIRQNDNNFFVAKMI